MSEPGPVTVTGPGSRPWEPLQSFLPVGLSFRVQAGVVALALAWTGRVAFSRMTKITAAL